MNLQESIRQLEGERDRIQRAIDALKSLQQPTLELKGRRGRKSMGQAERLEVSARMKRYWAKMNAKRKGAA